MKRHLIIKPSAIGDVIMAIPAVEALKRQQGGEIWWVCGELVEPVLARYGFVDRIIPLNEARLFKGSVLQRLSELVKVWRLLAGMSFETYAILQYNRKYRLLGLPIRATRNVFLKKGSRSREVIQGRRHTDEFARILLDLDGPISDRLAPIAMPGLKGKMPASRQRVGIVPGGAKNLVRDSPLRRWPLEFYVSLAKLLSDEGLEVVLFGAKSDRWTIPSFKDCQVTDQLGALSVVESIELIAQMDVFVTHDTGLLHMAGVTETPIVALFGPTAPWEFLPYREQIECFWGGEKLACRPCYDGNSLPTKCDQHLCLRATTPEMVFASVMSYIHQQSPTYEAQSGRRSFVASSSIVSSNAAAAS